MALGAVRKITRGPKPARALRELGLKPDLAAAQPTTAGIIASLRGEALGGRRIAVQLYGREPNRPLVEFLAGAGAQVSTVAPYVYADATDDAAVRALIGRLSAGGIDAIAFTSTPQVERLFAVGPDAEVRARPAADPRRRRRPGGGRGAAASWRGSPPHARRVLFPEAAHRGARRGAAHAGLNRLPALRRAPRGPQIRWRRGGDVCEHAPHRGGGWCGELENNDMKMEARTELTLRGLILGVLITLVFTAANVYFGLKAGLTFATSIPAAVISMAVLRAFSGATIQENNIVQTVASAAGTLSSIIFVLPGLVMIGWWTGFPYWVCFAICLFGGTLGVMYSIPLRRALVTQSDLPYPEGVACAEVLKVGSGEHGSGVEESRAGLSALLWGSVVSGAFSLITATRILASDVIRNFRVGRARGLGLRPLPVVRAVWGRASHRLVVRPGDAGGRAHRLGLGRAALLGAIGERGKPRPGGDRCPRP